MSPSATDSLSRLLAFSNRLHAEWAESLRAATGIDNGFLRCGGIYLASGQEQTEALRREAADWRQGGVQIQELSMTELHALEPRLSLTSNIDAAYLLPGEFQVRNPRHLQALLAACAQRGVKVTPNTAAEGFDISGGRLRAVHTSTGDFTADKVCICSGAWTQGIANHLGVDVAVKPIRGQIALLAGQRAELARIIYQGPLYLVPRADHRVLVGSTLEDVGFDRRTTGDAIARFLEFAIGLFPGLGAAQVERCWAGLRPGTADGMPYLGRLPDLENAFIAAGHYRSGLQLSTGTAVVMSQLMRGEQPQLDLQAFRVDRAHLSDRRVSV